MITRVLNCLAFDVVLYFGLQNLFPGMWLNSVSRDSYQVPEPPKVKSLSVSSVLIYCFATHTLLMLTSWGLT